MAESTRHPATPTSGHIEWRTASTGASLRFAAKRLFDVNELFANLGVERTQGERVEPEGRAALVDLGANDGDPPRLTAVLHHGADEPYDVQVAVFGVGQTLEGYVLVPKLVGDKIGRPGTGCLGAYVLDIASDEVRTFSAPHTVLATGGTGKVYLYTTNPDTATGDGVAMAWRAGCSVANMEFIQFHPTCLYHPQAKSFLISEAVRGEGGLLRRPDGSRFMPEHDPREELAPRDVVARAIDFEMKKHGLDCVFLDISHKPADFLEAHFPNILARCAELGIDITRQPIPVVPAAHYSCGGIVTDLHARTDVAGLHAIGESACTGLHGANRLASNSLLECLVFSEAAADDILNNPRPHPGGLPQWDESRVTDADEAIVISHNWDELRRFMWDYVGIVRTNKRLQRAQHRIRLLAREIEEFYSNFRVSNDLIELRNLVVTADLIVRSALQRRESRGLHFSRDYPDTLPKARDTVLRPSRTL